MRGTAPSSTSHAIGERLDQDTEGPRLTFAPTAWADFVSYASAH
ncbi:hypothetical protein [Streptomyces sp. NPDC093544]